jgi:OOP family OmpA-OmpF porin
MIRATIALCLLAGPLQALELALPATARQTAERNTAPDVYVAPVAPFNGSMVPTLSMEGEVERTAWRLNSPGLTPLQVIRPLRRQLQDAGFQIVLDCGSAACGGFDFRFATEILPAPNMYVNLRSYHFVTAVRPDAGAPQEVVTLLGSASSTSAYLQIIRAASEELAAVTVDTTATLPVPSDPEAEDLESRLLRTGHAILPDLDFSSGSTDLGPGPFGSLRSLAEVLDSRPTLRIALVGHTDTVGGLDPNIAISRARAGSVRNRLIEDYGIAPERLDAEGMGYLAPIASNLDPAGRDANRRVEAVLLSE